MRKTGLGLHVVGSDIEQWAKNTRTRLDQ